MLYYPEFQQVLQYVAIPFTFDSKFLAIINHFVAKFTSNLLQILINFPDGFVFFPRPGLIFPRNFEVASDGNYSTLTVIIVRYS